MSTKSKNEIQKRNDRFDKLNERIIEFTRELIIEFPEFNYIKIKRDLKNDTFSLGVGLK